MENNDKSSNNDSKSTKQELENTNNRFVVIDVDDSDASPTVPPPPPAAAVNLQEEEAGNDRVGVRPAVRTPFANLSQVDADLALARTLQDQERAYMLLRMNGVGGGPGGWGATGFAFDDDDDDDYENFDHPSAEEYDDTEVDDDDEDAFDVHAHSVDDENYSFELDPSDFSSDEAYARALQDAEDRDVAARLFEVAGIHEMIVGNEDDEEDNGVNSQDTWEDVDPDELSYEELLALGEVVGTESRGLPADIISNLPSINYKLQTSQEGNKDACVICRLDFEDAETLTLLSCQHVYHPECINNWLRINKVCPVCSTEVSKPGSS